MPQPAGGGQDNLPNRSGAKAFCFTYNNPTLPPQGIEALFGRKEYSYLVFQEEVGEQGTRHYQGYVEFRRRVRYTYFQRYLPQGETIWFATRRGTPEQASEYCKKPESRAAGPLAGPYEYGELSRPRQGRRTDLLAFRDAIIGGSTQLELIQEHTGAFARYGRFYDRLSALRQPVREQPPKVVLLHGATGTGKSRHVWDKHGASGQLYVIPIDSSGFWLDGYDRHSIALLDDFGGRSSKITLPALLRLLDRYPARAPIKGGFCWWCPKKIYITTNVHPAQWYDYTHRQEHYDALFRRFTKIKANMVTLPDEQIDTFKNQPQHGPPVEFAGAARNPHRA